MSSVVCIVMLPRPARPVSRAGIWGLEALEEADELYGTIRLRPDQ
jgi:hypothetical protein